jgi:hypothetical protein
VFRKAFVGRAFVRGTRMEEVSSARSRRGEARLICSGMLWVIFLVTGGLFVAAIGVLRSKRMLLSFPPVSLLAVGLLLRMIREQQQPPRATEFFLFCFHSRDRGTGALLHFVWRGSFWCAACRDSGGI